MIVTSFTPAFASAWVAISAMPVRVSVAVRLLRFEGVIARRVSVPACVSASVASSTRPGEVVVAYGGSYPTFRNCHTIPVDRNQSPCVTVVNTPPGGVNPPADSTITKYSLLVTEAPGSGDPLTNPCKAPSGVTKVIRPLPAIKPASVKLFEITKALICA